MNQFSNRKGYDLEDRTTKFAELVIELMRRLKQDSVNKRLIEQITASAGSIGANYCEANEAESKRDFRHKIAICKKEAKETRYWIRLLAKANPIFREDFRKLWNESQELLLIFSRIVQSSKKEI